MEKFLDSREAVSPIMGIFLLVGLVMVMASVVAISVFMIDLKPSGSSSQGGGGGVGGSETCIGAGFNTETKTGLSSDTPSFKFKDNQIILEHKMGCSNLDVNGIEITIYGYGEAQTAAFGTEKDDKKEKGDIIVVYMNLGYDKKEPEYKLNNPDISDGLQTGDRLVLNGYDGMNPTGGGGSTVIVNFTMDGNKKKKSEVKTSNKWAFDRNKVITITIKDIATQNTIWEKDVTTS